MSPILLRPIREQLEHDRILRQLQAKWRRRFEVGVNMGALEEVPVRAGSRTSYPDLILTDTSSGRRLHGVVEVETAESVNHLEAMAQWSHFAKVRGAFYLYVPAGFADVAQRLCEDARINVTEIWAYYAIGSQAKFSLSYRSPRARAVTAAAKTKAKSAKKTKATKATKKTKARTAKVTKKAKPKAKVTKKTKTAKKKVATKKSPKKAKKATKKATGKKAKASSKSKTRTKTTATARAKRKK